MAFIFTIASAFLSLYHRNLTRIAINEMGKGTDRYRIVLWFGLLVVLIRIISYLGLNAADLMKLKYRNNIRVTFGKNAIFHLIKLPMKILAGEKIGDNVTRFTSDIEGIADLIDNIISSVGLFTFTFIGAAYLTFLIDWKIAIISFFVIDPFTLALTKYFAPKIQENTKEERQNVAIVANNISEVIQGIETTKAYALEKFFMDIYEKIAIQLSNIRLELCKTNLLANFLTGSIPEISTGLILVYGGWRVVHGTLEAGDIWALMSYTMIVHGRILQITNIVFSFQKSIIQIEKINEILNRETENATGVKVVSEDLSLKFNNVTFSYNDDDDVLNDISFDLYPNDIVALVGVSGAGKSTLSKILIRLYDAKKGVIKLGGVNITDLDLNVLRNLIGYVPQEPFLFNMSIYDNIVLDKANVKMEDIVEASKIVDIYEFILSLNDGYDTVIGSGGLNISGGQKQRIVLAREIIRNPEILILDESTSAVDILTEKKILTNILYYFKDKIVIIIAHRPNTILYANKVFEINCGEIRDITNASEEYTHFD